MQKTFGTLSLGGLCPAARASLRGGEGCPGLAGTARFYSFGQGALVRVEVEGLPQDGFFGCHIHGQGECRQGGDVDFASAGGHYDPTGAARHPEHAGDLPNLLSSGGEAFMICYTGRFRPGDVVGRSVILHRHPDDAHSPDAGNAGERIACGVICAAGQGRF